MSAIGRPSIDRVTEVLASRPATTRDVMRATGYSRSTVETVLTLLRKQGAAELENYRREKKGKPTLCEMQERAEAMAAEEAELAKRMAEASLHIVQRALAARSPLELAWSAL